MQCASKLIAASSAVHTTENNTPLLAVMSRVTKSHLSHSHAVMLHMQDAASIKRPAISPPDSQPSPKRQHTTGDTSMDLDAAEPLMSSNRLDQS